MTAVAAPRPLVRPGVSAESWVRGVGIWTLVAFLTLAIALPLGMLLSKSFLDSGGSFVGLANYLAYFKTPSLVGSLWARLGRKNQR